jgi:hypothetical protein
MTGKDKPPPQHIEFRFIDTAAAYCFENEIEHAEVIIALEGPHYRQPSGIVGRTVHYVRIAGQTVKVVTGVDDLTRDGSEAILAVVPLYVR